MNVLDTPLRGLKIVETDVSADARGTFERLYCSEAWSAVRPGLSFAQVNLSVTRNRGTVRGMHFQHAPAADAKSIRCLRGRVFDVAVDLRPGSPTFLQWHGIELHEGSPRELFIPEGFAHGFQSLEDNAQLLYFHTAAWEPAHEGGVRHDDPAVGIEWPLAPVNVSGRDLQHPLIDAAFKGIR